MEPLRFALIGAAGFVAPRHMEAIRRCGHQLVAAVDPHDSVGILDRYFPDVHFFTEIERFDRHLEKLRRRGEGVDYVSVCSPNYLHDAHVRLALRLQAHALCEKPLVISPWNLDALAELEAEHGRRVNTVLQLRLHPDLIALKESLSASTGTRRQVRLTYVTRRGRWYGASWKGSESRSGGLAMNIGIHFFDLLLWLFGPVEESRVFLSGPEKMAGRLELEGADVDWFLSVDVDDLPAAARQRGDHASRTLTMDGEDVEFSSGFADLHTRVYERALAGQGFGIEDARPSIELVHALREAAVEGPGPAVAASHPAFGGKI